MTDYISTILNDGSFYLCVSSFAGLIVFFFVVGYSISLIVALLYKIIR